MNYRLATIKAKESFTTDITKIIDINVQDPISQLIIELTVTSGSSVFTAHPLECLTKIELVDGSDVLFSLSGKEADALDWYHSGGKFRNNWNYWITGTCQNFIGINFGRYLWDPILAFDPKKFKNPQLKLTLNIDGGGGSASANTLAVWAAMFDQKAATPVGFLMAKELKSYAMGASAHEYTDMPTDYKWRKLLVRCQTAGTEPGQLINTIKLTEDVDKRIIFEDEADDILRTIAALYPAVREEFFTSIATTANYYAYITPTTRITGHGTRWATSSTDSHIAIYNGDGGRLNLRTLTNTSNAQIHVAGSLPHGVYDIPMGLPNEMEDWFDVSTIGNLKADILARSGASASNSVQLMLQQLRTY